MLEIRQYQQGDLEDAVQIFKQLSLYYLGENASSENTIRQNLTTAILGPHSGVQLILAFADKQVVGMATISFLYPAPKETGQLFLKELFVCPDQQGKGIG